MLDSAEGHELGTRRTAVKIDYGVELAFANSPQNLEPRSERAASVTCFAIEREPRDVRICSVEFREYSFDESGYLKIRPKGLECAEIGSIKDSLSEIAQPDEQYARILRKLLEERLCHWKWPSDGLVVLILDRGFIDHHHRNLIADGIDTMA
jgi:hypothetical protein